MKNYKKILFLFIISILVSACSLFNKNNLNFKDYSSYKIIEEYEDTDKVFRALYKNDNSFLKIDKTKNIEKGDFENLKNDKTKKFLEIYNNNISPYPGELSNVSTCNKDLMPIEVNTNNNIFYKTYLNNRFQFGTCVEEQLKYKVILGYIYCEDKKEFYQIEYFIDKSRENSDEVLNDFVKSIKCN